MKHSTKEGLDAWAREARPPGSFLYAILTNNLKEAFAQADEENERDMQEIVAYCYNYLPCNCWGSPENVEEWGRIRQ